MNIPAICCLTIGVCLLIALTILLFSNGKGRLSRRREFRYHEKRLKELQGTISAKLAMYQETQKLCRMAKDFPILKNDIEEYIKYRNEVFDIDYTIENVRPFIGKGDDRNE